MVVNDKSRSLIKTLSLPPLKGAKPYPLILQTFNEFSFEKIFYKQNFKQNIFENVLRTLSYDQVFQILEHFYKKIFSSYMLK